MADLDKIVDSLSDLSVIEAAELVKKLEEKWDVSAAAPAAVAVAGPAGGGEEAEEKDAARFTNQRSRFLKTSERCGKILWFVNV